MTVRGRGERGGGGERGGERGGVLLLFPAAFLIVMVLAAITVDTSIAFLGQRELAEATSAAANDAAADALSEAAFYGEDRIDLDPARVVEVATARVAQIIDPSRHEGLQVRATIMAPSGPGCPPRVEVAASSTVSYLFARAVPGGPDSAAVSARSTATPTQSIGGGC